MKAEEGRRRRRMWDESLDEVAICGGGERKRWVLGSFFFLSKVKRVLGFLQLNSEASTV